MIAATSVAAHQGEIGQREIEDAARQPLTARLHDGRPGADEEAPGEAHHHGLGLERSQPFGEPLGEAPQAGRFRRRDGPAEDRQRVGLERGQRAAQTENGRTGRDEHGADSYGGDQQQLDLSAAEAGSGEHTGLHDHGDNAPSGGEEDLDREDGRQESSHQGEADDQHVPRAPAHPSQDGAGEQDEDRQSGRDGTGRDDERRQAPAPIHQHGQGGGLVAGRAGLNQGEGAAIDLAVAAELHAEIDAAVLWLARLKVFDDPYQLQAFGIEFGPIGGGALLFPEAEEHDGQGQQDGGGHEASERA